MSATAMSAAGLATAIRRGDLGAVEVVDAFIERIERVDAVLNAVVVRRFEAARAEARNAEKTLRSAAAVGPLHGVPITVKEAIAVAGLPWTTGSRLFQDRIADRDARSVRRLRAAGAIVLGKTNVPEFCGFYDTDNDVYGRTCNPHDSERTPGGSSGGEAAALAARLSPLGVGSDLASSIRQPAAWCGVLGLKPSRELVPIDGHAGFGLPFGWRTGAVIGPMARTVADLELALGVMSGRSLAPATAPVRIAVYEEDGLQPVAAACRAAVRRAAEALSAIAVPIVDAAPPHARELREVFDLMILTEAALFASPALGGREGELSRYGRGLAEAAAAVEVDLEAYADAGRRLSELEVDAEAWFDEHPIALCPVTPVAAPRAAEGIVSVDGEPPRPGGKLTLCTYASIVGLPSASVPCGRDEDGLPLAVQVIGRRGCDLDVLGVARTLEEALGGVLDPDEAPRSATRGVSTTR